MAERIRSGQVNDVTLSSEIVAQKLGLNGDASRRRRELRDDADGHERHGRSRISHTQGIPADRSMSSAFRLQLCWVETLKYARSASSARSAGDTMRRSMASRHWLIFRGSKRRALPPS